MKCKIPRYTSYLFWDIKKDLIDIKNHSKFIIKRVLEFGEAKTIKWLRSTYPDRLIKSVVKEKKGLSNKTVHFWTEYFKQR